MGKDKKKQLGVLGLIVALVIVLIGGLIFMGAVAGWFDDPKVVIDGEYVCDNESGCDYMELTAGEYDELVKTQKSFVVFVDQDGCTTADRLRGYVSDWATSRGMKVYRMMFAEVKESSLHDQVKYYPSVVVVDKGVVRAWLRADSDEDAEMYNNYDAFNEWMGRYL